MCRHVKHHNTVCLMCCHRRYQHIAQHLRIHCSINSLVNWCTRTTQVLVVVNNLGPEAAGGGGSQAPRTLHITGIAPPLVNTTLVEMRSLGRQGRPGGGGKDGFQVSWIENVSLQLCCSYSCEDGPGTHTFLFSKEKFLQYRRYSTDVAKLSTVARTIIGKDHHLSVRLKVAGFGILALILTALQPYDQKLLNLELNLGN